MTEMATSQIFDDWRTYEKIVTNDYMYHREFFEALTDEIAARLSEPLSVVDIGCGDARPVVPLLERFRVDRYVGIDQSRTALGRASAALSALSISSELRPGSMLEELRGLDGAFDLAIASYSLHHLDSSEKEAALAHCRRLLTGDGMLAVIDVFLREGESRPAYFARWQENARRRFLALAADELEMLLDHVRDCDIPETVSDYRRLGESAGFKTMESITEDPDCLNRVVILC